MFILNIVIFKLDDDEIEDYAQIFKVIRDKI